MIKSIFFAANESIVEQAIKNIEEDWLRIWYAKEFKLPYHHELMQDVSYSEMALTYYEFTFLDDEKFLKKAKMKIDGKKNIDREWFENELARINQESEAELQSKGEIIGNMQIDGSLLKEIVTAADNEGDKINYSEQAVQELKKHGIKV